MYYSPMNTATSLQDNWYRSTWDVIRLRKYTTVDSQKIRTNVLYEKSDSSFSTFYDKEGNLWRVALSTMHPVKIWVWVFSHIFTGCMVEKHHAAGPSFWATGMAKGRKGSTRLVFTQPRCMAVWEFAQPLYPESYTYRTWWWIIDQNLRQSVVRLQKWILRRSWSCMNAFTEF